MYVLTYISGTVPYSVLYGVCTCPCHHAYLSILGQTDRQTDKPPDPYRQTDIHTTDILTAGRAGHLARSRQRRSTLMIRLRWVVTNTIRHFRVVDLLISLLRVLSPSHLIAFPFLTLPLPLSHLLPSTTTLLNNSFHTHTLGRVIIR